MMMRWVKKFRKKTNEPQPQQQDVIEEESKKKKVVVPPVIAFEDHVFINLRGKDSTSLVIPMNTKTLKIEEKIKPEEMDLIIEVMQKHLHKVRNIEIDHIFLNGDVIVKLMNMICQSEQHHISKMLFSFEMNSDAAAKAVAKAIESGNLPSKCMIGLNRTKISDVGAMYIAHALEHPKCPDELYLELLDNKITNEGAEKILAVLKGHHYKRKLNIRFASHECSEELQTEIEKLNNQNQMRFDVFSCLSLYKGLTDPQSPVSILNRNIDVMKLITPHVISKEFTIKETRKHRRQFKKKHHTHEGFMMPRDLIATNMHIFYKTRLRPLVNNTDEMTMEADHSVKAGAK